MFKIGLFASLLSIASVLTLATYSASANDAPAAAPCVHTSFKTELVKDACTKGGQKAAKDAMKIFMKEKKIKSCNLCHEKLAPDYPLKPDAYDQFKKLGGKVLDAKAAPAKDAPKK